MHVLTAEKITLEKQINSPNNGQKSTGNISDKKNCEGNWKYAVMENSTFFFVFTNVYGVTRNTEM